MEDLNRAQQTLLYAEATQRAADTAGVIERAHRRPFTNDPLLRMEMQATQDDAKRARRKARTAAWEATVAFCNQNGIKL